MIGLDQAQVRQECLCARATPETKDLATWVRQGKRNLEDGDVILIDKDGEKLASGKHPEGNPFSPQASRKLVLDLVLSLSLATLAVDDRQGNRPPCLMWQKRDAEPVRLIT
ncbi:MAG: hypothetical protein EBZ67_17445 [Chitinophagia bacterium]|nr:hypothetical protein [Chitinophagia bacterium]